MRNEVTLVWGSLRLAPIKKEQKNFRVQLLFEVRDLSFYAADLHGTRTFQLVI